MATKEVDFQRILDMWKKNCPMCEQPVALSDADKERIEIQFQAMGYDYNRLDYIMQIIGRSQLKRTFRWLLNRNANWRKIENGDF